MVAWGNKRWGGDCSEIQDQLVANVQSIYAAEYAFAALKADGTVVAWGSSGGSYEYGGDCSTVQTQLVDVRHIYSTRAAFAALKTDGSVVSWGSNRNEAEALARLQSSLCWG